MTIALRTRREMNFIAEIRRAGDAADSWMNKNCRWAAREWILRADAASFQPLMQVSIYNMPTPPLLA
jgi:hypothetical protein